MRPVFSKIFFQDEFLHFPELGTTAKLPKDAARVRREIQERLTLGSDVVGCRWWVLVVFRGVSSVFEKRF